MYCDTPLSALTKSTIVSAYDVDDNSIWHASSMRLALRHACSRCARITVMGGRPGAMLGGGSGSWSGSWSETACSAGPTRCEMHRATSAQRSTTDKRTFMNCSNLAPCSTVCMASTALAHRGQSPTGAGGFHKLPNLTQLRNEHVVDLFVAPALECVDFLARSSCAAMVFVERNTRRHARAHTVVRLLFG